MMFFAKRGMISKKRSVVDDRRHDLAHVVGLTAVRRHEVREFGALAIRIVFALAIGRPVEVVERQIAHELTHGEQHRRIVGRSEMRDARLLGMHTRAAQILAGHGLVRNLLDHVRPGDVHVARALGHHHEVRDRRRVDRPARTWAEDRRDLRHDARSESVAQKEIGVAPQAHDAFLDARAAGVIETDDRHAELHGHIHGLAEFLGVALAEAPAKDREVLAEDHHRPLVDRRGAADDAIAEDVLLVHAEVTAAMRDEAVHLHEAAGIDEHVDPLARGQLALGMLGLDALFAAALERLLLHLLESCDGFGIGHRGISTSSVKTPSMLFG
jgi:hypothetical protein